MEELFTFIQKLSGAGLAGVCVLIIYGGYKRYWVWGYQLEEMRVDRDEWKELALRNTQFAERAVSLVVKQP